MTNEGILEMLVLDKILNTYPPETKYDVEKMQERCDELIHQFLKPYVKDKSE